MASKTDRRGHEPRHIRLYHSVTGCAAWQDLSGNAIKLLVALMRLDKGGDNGSLFLSVRKAAEAINVSINTASRVFHELEDHGFIAAVDRGHFKVKDSPATTWRLTWLPAPGCKPAAPTRDFERWSAKGNNRRSQILTGMVPKTETVIGNADPTVSIIETVGLETPLVSVDRSVSFTATQVVSQGLAARGRDTEHRKRGEAGAEVSTDLLDSEFLEQLRHRTAAWISASGVGEQTRIANDAKIPGGTLSKFLAGRGLSRQHFVALQLIINSRTARQAAA